jgi:hypothetical protein
MNSRSQCNEVNSVTKHEPGKEKPFCMEENEVCLQQNRRGHFVTKSSGGLWFGAEDNSAASVPM